MRQIELRPGETIRIMVHKDPRYFQEETFISYHISTPVWGQDDGTAGNLFIECIKGVGGELDTVVAAGGDDSLIDFGDPMEQDQVRGRVIRLANEHQ